METTDRLSMPLLSPGQAQKEISHNEALQIVDMLLAGAVEESPRNNPPTSPLAGACFIVGESPTDEWSGRADHLAAYTLAGWRFVAPREGMSLHNRATGEDLAYHFDGWEAGTVRCQRLIIDGVQVVGGRSVPIADPIGGPIIDAEARSAVGSILAALRQHGLIAE